MRAQTVRRAALGDDLATLHTPYSKAPLNVVVKQSDYRWLSTGLRHWRGPVRMIRVGMRTFVAKARRQKLIGMGGALMANSCSVCAGQASRCG